MRVQYGVACVLGCGWRGGVGVACVCLWGVGWYGCACAVQGGRCVYCDVVCMKVSVGPEGIQVGGVHLARQCGEFVWRGVCGRNVCMFVCVCGGGGEDV